MTVGGTMLLGIIGSFVGGFLADAALPQRRARTSASARVGIIGSTIGAILCLLVYRMANGRAAAASAPRPPRATDPPA